MSLVEAVMPAEQAGRVRSGRRTALTVTAIVVTAATATAAYMWWRRRDHESEQPIWPERPSWPEKPSSETPQAVEESLMEPATSEATGVAVVEPKEPPMDLEPVNAPELDTAIEVEPRLDRADTSMVLGSPSPSIEPELQPDIEAWEAHAEDAGAVVNSYVPSLAASDDFRTPAERSHAATAEPIMAAQGSRVRTRITPRLAFQPLTDRFVVPSPRPRLPGARDNQLP